MDSNVQEFLQKLININIPIVYSYDSHIPYKIRIETSKTRRI